MSDGGTKASRANRGTLFTAAAVARVAAIAEGGLLAAYDWLPYPSDLEHDAVRARFLVSLEKINVALGVVREARAEAERRIIAEATKA